MAAKMIASVLIFSAILQIIKAQTSLYTGAILEFTPTTDPFLSAFDNVLSNTREYVEFTRQAKASGAAIVVFPEYGLTTTTLPNDLETISTVVPVNVTPVASDLYGKHLIDLSAAAKEHNIYLVANLIEKETNNATNATLYYNTNVVFDRSGTIMTKYRKINLQNEPKLTPGTELVTFRTDFGVIFGLLTSFDILFKNPGVDLLLLGNVTDVIYSTSWLSETPFMQALTIQDGYSKTHGVNMMAAGYNNRTAFMGGGGFYFARSSTAHTVLSPADVRNVVVRPMPMIVARDKNAVCTNNQQISPRIGTLPPVESLETASEDMQFYTFKSLPNDVSIFNETVCSDGSDFCCTFAIQLNQSFSETNTIYKVAALNGVRNAGSKTIGVRACNIVACQNEQDSSCGKRSTTSGTNNVQFQQITVYGTFPRDDNSEYYPSTLTHNLATMVGYSFCRDATVEDKVTVTMATNGISTDLFSFGIFGRVYDRDGQPAGRSGSSPLNAGSAILVLLLTYILVH